MKNSCIYCGEKTYLLGNGMLKCSSCLRKYSLVKLERQLALIEAFCNDLTAMQAARTLSINYITAKKFYNKIRRLLIIVLQKNYADHYEDVLEYDEYLYLDHSKRKDKRYIFDAHNFLTFDYGGKVYNILLPSLNRYKNGFQTGEDELQYKEISRFLKLNRIAKLESFDNTIERFWMYFDGFMKKYRGIKSENFIYYLKEAEYKFNYESNERIETLKKLWLRYRLQNP